MQDSFYTHFEIATKKGRLGAVFHLRNPRSSGIWVPDNGKKAEELGFHPTKHRGSMQSIDVRAHFITVEGVRSIVDDESVCSMPVIEVCKHEDVGEILLDANMNPRFLRDRQREMFVKAMQELSVA